MWCMQELLSLFPTVETDPEPGSAQVAIALRTTVTSSDEQQVKAQQAEVMPAAWLGTP